MTWTGGLSFPPLFHGEAISPAATPMDTAVSRAKSGADTGLIVYAEDPGAMRVAVLLTPEIPLEDAIGVIFAAALGLADSLGAIAPPEVAVQFTWPGGFMINGARCGRLRATASTGDPNTIPDWLVIAIDMPILPDPASEPGDTPDQTVLIEEGCADITAPLLIESWSRHMLYWINRFVDEGLAPLHKNWTGKCDDSSSAPDGTSFLGLDEKGGMLLRKEGATILKPLTKILESTS